MLHQGGYKQTYGLVPRKRDVPAGPGMTSRKRVLPLFPISRPMPLLAHPFGFFQKTTNGLLGNQAPPASQPMGEVSDTHLMSAVQAGQFLQLSRRKRETESFRGQFSGNLVTHSFQSLMRNPKNKNCLFSVSLVLLIMRDRTNPY